MARTINIVFTFYAGRIGEKVEVSSMGPAVVGLF